MRDRKTDGLGTMYLVANCILRSISRRPTSSHMVVLHLHAPLSAPAFAIAVRPGVVFKPCKFQSINPVVVQAILSQKPPFCVEREKKKGRRERTSLYLTGESLDFVSKSTSVIAYTLPSIV
jgi:hypothetical protein